MNPFIEQIRRSIRNKIPVGKIILMLSGCIRDRSIYFKARENLFSNLFTDEELPFAVIWKAVNNIHTPKIRVDLFNNETAYHQLVEIETNSVFEKPEIKSNKYHAIAYKNCFDENGLINHIFRIDRELLVKQEILEILSAFLIERTVNDQILKATSLENHYIHDIDNIFKCIYDQYRKCLNVKERKQQNLIDLLKPENVFSVMPKLLPSGIPWLDEMMGGGFAKKECYVLLGPTGGGKSFFCNQIMVTGAQLQAVIDRQNGKGQYWYYFTYELSKEQMLPRILQCGARVHINTLRQGEIDQLSDASSLKEYEFSEYINPSHIPYRLGEKERIEQFLQSISGKNGQSMSEIVDFSGDEGGDGGVDEIAAYLHNCSEEGKHPIGVVIDYAGHCVYRYVESRRMRPETVFSILPNFVDRVRNLIAVPFDCVVWVVHQLHGNATKGKQGIIHHTDAFGSRNFGMGADFCFQLSKYCEHTKLLKLHLTKCRRGAPNSEGKVLEFRPEFGVFVEPDRQFVQESDGQYIPAEVARIFREEETRTSPYRNSRGMNITYEELLN